MSAKEVSAAEAISALCGGLPPKEDNDEDNAASASPTGADSTTEAEQKKPPATGDGDDEEIIMDEDDDEGAGGDGQDKLRHASAAEKDSKPPAVAAHGPPTGGLSGLAAIKGVTSIVEGKGGATLLKGAQGKFISNNKVKRASKYKGVGFDSKMGKWKARVHYEHKDIMVGSFETEGEAALAYDVKARQLFGEEAVTNFDLNGDWNPLAKTTIQVPKKGTASAPRAAPAPPSITAPLPPRRRESKSPGARETPTAGTQAGGGDPALHNEPASSLLSSQADLDSSRARYPKRGDGQEGEEQPGDHLAGPPGTTINEEPKHCLLTDPTAAPSLAPQGKRKGLASGPDIKKKRKQAGGGNNPDVEAVDRVDDYSEVPANWLAAVGLSKAPASSASASASASSKCGSRGRDTAVVAREAAELLLGRLMDRHDAVYDRALQLFYKDKDVARAIIECVVQAYESNGPSGRQSM